VKAQGVYAREAAVGKWCWTCGEQKALYLFAAAPDQYDGLAAECLRCAECREIARRLDGQTGPRTTPIEGEGRRKPAYWLAPLERAASLATLSWQSSLRARPRSGLRREVV